MPRTELCSGAASRGAENNPEGFPTGQEIAQRWAF